MQNYNEILEKIKDILSQKIGIAHVLNINYDSFRKQKARNSNEFSS